MAFSPLIENLINSFRCLPGVGPKTAQRLAFYILARDKEGGQRLAHHLKKAIEDVKHCIYCRNFTEMEICSFCLNTKRDHNLLCIVENPTDIVSIEQTGSYSGLYFVLMGHLSPLDGIGPKELGMPLLLERLQDNEIKEIIFATNPTTEGDATANFIAQISKPYCSNFTRIAHGVPVGGDLEWVNADTLSRAMIKRDIWPI